MIQRNKNQKGNRGYQSRPCSPAHCILALLTSHLYLQVEKKNCMITDIKFKDCSWTLKVVDDKQRAAK